MILATKPVSCTVAAPSWLAPRPRPDGRQSPSPYAALARAVVAPPPSSPSPASGGPAPSHPPARQPAPAEGVDPFAADPDAPAPSVRSVEAAIGNALRASLRVPSAVDPLARELGMQAEIAGLQGALAAAVADAARVRREVLEASEPALVELAIAIAEQVIGQRLSDDPAIFARLAREGVDALLDQEEVVVAVAPDLAEKVPAEVWASALEGRAELVTDPALESMRCEVRGRKARVEADPRARLRAVVDALRDEGDGAEAPGSGR